jgi:pseudaminic acid cytidylyltransferase
MISYPIKALRESGLFSQIIVSTDDDEIAEVSISVGADRVIRRSSELGENSTPTVEVIASAVEDLKIHHSSDVCVAYATNPLLNSAAIKVAFRIHKSDRSINYTTTVAKYGFPPQRSLAQSGNKLFVMNDPSHMYTNSQDLKPVFHETGQFWWGKADRWLARVGMQEGLAGIVLPGWMEQDIDDEEDWLVAEAKFDYGNQNSSLKWSEEDIIQHNLKYGISVNR